MKLTLNFSLIFITILSTNLKAQPELDFRRAKLGFILGPNFSKVHHAHNPSSHRYSFFMGAFTRIPVGIFCSCENPNFYIQPQIEYIQTGEKGEKNTLYANNFLSIPIYFKTYPIEFNEQNYLFVQAGPRFSFLVNQNVKNPPLGRPYDISQDGKANNFDFSISFASGISFGARKNELLFRYDYSFSNSYPYLDEYLATGDPNARLRKIQHIVSIAYSRTIFNK